jgi:hypothetical protein
MVLSAALKTGLHDFELPQDSMDFDDGRHQDFMAPEVGSLFLSSGCTVRLQL